MTENLYTAHFTGGAFHGGKLNYKKKIGGYVRFTYNGQVFEYGRTDELPNGGVYEFIDRDAE